MLGSFRVVCAFSPALGSVRPNPRRISPAGTGCAACARFRSRETRVRDCVRSWGAALPAARARRCSPGPGRLQLHVVRRRGQAVAVLLMSVLGRSGRRKKSGLRPWLAAEPRVVATRSCRCCSGNRRRVHSRPAWNCSCWGRCGAWALKQSGSSRRVSLRPAGMRRRFGLPGLPGVLRSMSLRFPSVGGGRAEMRQWARIRSRGPPAEGVGSSVR